MNDEKCFPIKNDDELKVLSYPNKGFKNEINLSDTSFTIDSYDYWHNGIHIYTKDEITAVCDGEVEKIRFSPEYKTETSMEERVISFAEYSGIKTKKDYKGFKIGRFFETNEKGYVLKKKLSDEEKIEAYCFMDKFYSNSYVLLKHKVKNKAEKEIIFYSLYNHLKPLKRFTLGQKLDFLFYDKKISLLKIPEYTYIKATSVENGKTVEIPSETAYSKGSYDFIESALLQKRFGYIKRSYLKTVDKNSVLVKRLKLDKSENGSFLGDSDVYNTRIAGTVKNRVFVYSDETIEKRKISYLFDYETVFTVGLNYNAFKEYIEQNANKTKYTDIKGIPVKFELTSGYLFLSINDLKKTKDFIKNFKDDNIYTNDISSDYTITFSFYGPNGGFKINKANRLENLTPSDYTDSLKLYNFVKIIIDKNGNTEYIPCDAEITKTENKFDFEIVSFNIFSNDYKDYFVNKSDIRHDSYKEVKRTLNIFENDKNSTEYFGRNYSLKKSDKILIYSDISRSGRKVIDMVNRTTIFTLLDPAGFYKVFKDEKKEYEIYKTGIYVEYPDLSNAGKTKRGYIYLAYDQGLANITGNQNELKKRINDFKNGFCKELEKPRYREDIYSNTYLNLTMKLKDTTKKIAVHKGQVIGYSGFTLIDEKEKKVREDNTEVHFETYFGSNQNNLLFMDFNEKDGKYNALIKINKACKVHTDSLLTQTFPLNHNNFSLFGFNKVNKGAGFVKKAMNLFSVINKPEETIQNFINFDINPDVRKLQYFSKTNEVELVPGEKFYELSKKGSVIILDENEYITRNNLGEWKENEYYSVDKFITSVQVYSITEKVVKKVEGKTVNLYPGIKYYSKKVVVDIPEGTKKQENMYRQIKYFLQPDPFYEIMFSDDKFYVSEKTLQRFTHENDYYILLSGAEIKADEMLERPVSTMWTEKETEISVGEYDWKDMVVQEVNRGARGQKWQLAQKGKEKIWIKIEDISTDIETAKPVTKMIYDDWKKFFVPLTSDKKISIFGQFKCEQKEKFLNTLGLIYDKNKSANSIVKDNRPVVNNVYFQNETEWCKNEKAITTLVNDNDSEYEDDIRNEKENYAFYNSNEQFVYFNPPAFLNHLDRVLRVDDFNPYLGKTYAEIYSDKTAPNVDLNTWVKDTPGFAPRWEKGQWAADSNPNTGGFAAVNGFFNHLYTDIRPNYHHEGVDFRGADKTEIVSFINAKVIAYGWMTDSNGSIYGSGYGQTIFLYDLNHKGIYQLSHLSAYDESIYVGKVYSPRDVVAYVGNSGHGLINDNEHWPTHLHVSYYDMKYNELKDKFVYRNGNEIKRTGNFNATWSKLRNPFDHNSSEIHGGFN